MELSPTRNAHFNKVSFFVPDAVFDTKWNPKDSQNGATKPLKIDQKSDAFFNRKHTDFLWKLEPKGSLKGPQNEELGGQFGHPPLDPPGEPNGPKIESKWTKNAPKMELNQTENGSKMEPTWS